MAEQLNVKEDTANARRRAISHVNDAEIHEENVGKVPHGLRPQDNKTDGYITSETENHYNDIETCQYRFDVFSKMLVNITMTVVIVEGHIQCCHFRIQQF